MENVIEHFTGGIVCSARKKCFPINTHKPQCYIKKTECHIEYGDGFSMSKCQYFISRTYMEMNVLYTAECNGRLVHNLIPYLFPRFIVKS